MDNRWFESPSMKGWNCTVINGWQFWHNGGILRQAYSWVTYLQFRK